MPRTAILIGTPGTLGRLERRLDLMDDRPMTLGWVLTSSGEEAPTDAAILGIIDELESIVARRMPVLALVCLPAALSELTRRIRTRLRRLGVADRFIPTLEDLVAGIGPRTQFDIDPGLLLDRPPREIDEDAVRGVIRGRRVLITGAGGSIGSELARIVSRFEPAHLILMDRAENALFEIDRQIARGAPEMPRTAVLHDVVDRDGTLEHCRRLLPEVIFHAAAHKHVPMMEVHPGAAVDNLSLIHI